MKIALIAPIEETVPPQKYGGTEWIVYHLAHELGSRGHQVHLYASGDSKEEDFYNLIPIIEKSIRNDPSIKDDSQTRDAYKYYINAKIIRELNQKDYDIIHNHAGGRFLIFSGFLKRPERIITTIHRFFPYQKFIFSQYKNSNYVSISNNERKEFSDLNYLDTIYNGISVTDFPFSKGTKEKGNDYMFFLARMNQEKGAIEAVKTAIKTKKKLIMAAKVDLADKDYFEEFKKINSEDFVKFLGEIGPEARLKYLQGAKCLLVPIQWEEPFGLMFVEAMSCGTPVITYARGSVPELIKDGITGFIVNYSANDTRGDFLVKKTGVEGLSGAVEKLYSMPVEEYQKMRKNCRDLVENNFSVVKMVEGYEEVYKKIAGIKK